MSDAHLRDLERLANQGDLAAKRRLGLAHERVGRLVCWLCGELVRDRHGYRDALHMPGCTWWIQ